MATRRRTNSEPQQPEERQERRQAPPAGAAAHDGTEYNPFLKSEHLDAGDHFTLTGWIRRLSGQFGPQIIVEVTQDKTGQAYDLAVKEGSAMHRALFKGMGRDPHKWEGSIILTTRAGDRGPYLAIDSIDSHGAPF